MNSGKQVMREWTEVFGALKLHMDRTRFGKTDPDGKKPLLIRVGKCHHGLLAGRIHAQPVNPYPYEGIFIQDGCRRYLFCSIRLGTG